MSKRNRPIISGHRRYMTKAGGYCVGCRAHRQHVLKVIQGEDGHCHAVWTCTHDGTSFLAGGFICAMCGHPWLRVEWVRHSRPGVKTRCLACPNCGTKHITGERVERVIE